MQASFAQMGTPLSEVVFVVVDLETTGGPPGADAITEIGAVRVRGGAVESEMSTLVNPGKDSWLIVETSSFQAESIDEFHPRVSALLNLGPDHIRFYSLAARI